MVSYYFTMFRSISYIHHTTRKTLTHTSKNRNLSYFIPSNMYQCYLHVISLFEWVRKHGGNGLKHLQHSCNNMIIQSTNNNSYFFSKSKYPTHKRLKGIYYYPLSIQIEHKISHHSFLKSCYINTMSITHNLILTINCYCTKPHN